MLEILILYLLLMIFQGCGDAYTLYWVVSKKSATEMVPGCSILLEKLGWWYLPIDITLTGLIALGIIVFIPPIYSAIVISLWIGADIGVLYRDYYAIRFYRQKIRMTGRVESFK